MTITQQRLDEIYYSTVDPVLTAQEEIDLEAMVSGPTES